ncbi:receptor protein kinase TMK1-like [Panicum miliaceum]|uniref:Receptor protein kinase TMK1-like n=1 Tax=Panicum miliaceum TaxID=4540 RepID=A0A3L6TFI1_PANMI|nr:receptor protein kinase TMK1-like [Panicum miliaceum]
MSLNGTIHPAFASLRSLETIFLTGNNISGAIPPALTQLPALLFLDVSDNLLDGSLPKFGRGMEVWAEGNPGLNVSSVSPPSMPEQPRLTIIFVVVAVLVWLPSGRLDWAV